MKKTMPKTIKRVFYSMTAIFVLIMILLFIPKEGPLRMPLFYVMAALGLAFLVLGVVLIVLAIKSKLEKRLKILLIVAGSAAAGIFVFAILHNLVYGLLIYIFGPEFWGENGDEALFFILAIIVCPITYLVCTIWSTIILARKKR